MVIEVGGAFVSRVSSSCWCDVDARHRRAAHAIGIRVRAVGVRVTCGRVARGRERGATLRTWEASPFT